MRTKKRNTPFCCLSGLLAAVVLLTSCLGLALLVATLLVGGGRSGGQAAGSLAAIPASERTVYYRIEGDTAWDLRQQMDHLGPLDEDGHRWSALTHWRIRWSYRYLRGIGRCATGPVKVELEIVYTIPRWEPPASAEEELVERWEEYMTALVAHEQGHAEIAKQAAQAVQQAVQDLPDYPTCHALEYEADALGERILEEFRQRQAEYDRLTEHGLTQGACFP